VAEADREGVALERDWLVERVLAPLVPEEWRDVFIGDLVEEARCFILPTHGPHRARRWLRWQIVRSLPELLRHQITQGAGRRIGRIVFAVLLVRLGAVQAWDSRVHHASPLVIGIVATALAIVACTMHCGRRSTTWLALILAVPVLLIAARLLSPVVRSDLLTLIPALTLGPLWLGGWLPSRQGTTRCA
jgi:hypothetical protein